MIKHNHTLALKAWERQFKAGTLEFKQITKADLPPNTRRFVEHFLEPSNITFEMASTIYGQVLLRLNDVVVGFLAHCPRCSAHLWGKPDMTDINNNLALARFAELAGVCDAGTARQVFDALDAADSSN